MKHPVSGTLLLCFLAPAAGWGQEAAPAGSCADPVYLQVEARAADRATDQERLVLWREFLKNSPDNPCRDQVYDRINELQGGEAHDQETRVEAQWRQVARGGLIEPDLEVFPPFHGLPDPAPRNRLRLLNEFAALNSDWAYWNKVEAWLFAQVLTLEAAPFKYLGLSVDLPLVLGAPREGSAGYALGNLLFGLRAIWGMRLAEQTLPLIISGGAWWSPASSGWPPGDKTIQLDAASWAFFPHYAFFRMNQPVYGVHLEAEIGLAKYFLVAALSYQVLVQEERTSLKGLLRWDLGWQARWWDWITPAVEVHGAEGFLLKGRRDALFLSPEVRLHFGHFSGWLSIQIPLLDAAKYDKIVMALELAAQL